MMILGKLSLSKLGGTDIYVVSDYTKLNQQHKTNLQACDWFITIQRAMHTNSSAAPHYIKCVKLKSDNLPLLAG